jgi:sugar lactone lactonase YvrE
VTTPRTKTIGKQISQWGEGPIWWGNSLFYVDIAGNKLLRLNPETSEESIWDVGERIGTIVPSKNDDEVIYAGDTGYVRFNLKTGSKAALADPEASMRGKNRFNDGKCDPAGRFWAGTISMVKDAGSANLYCLDTDGSLSLKVSGVTNSNGICWNAEATKMFYIDTPTQNIRAYDYDIESGNISNARVVVDTAAHGYSSSPDGMTIDADGMLWVAFCHGACVVRFNPRTNKELRPPLRHYRNQSRPQRARCRQGIRHRRPRDKGSPSFCF